MIRHTLLALLCLLLAACHVVPKHYEDDRVYVVNHQVFIRHADKLTPAEFAETERYYTAPHLDDAERRALRWRVGLESADFVTTIIGLSSGCVEANPLFGARPGYGVILAAKAIPAWMAYSHAKRSPEAFSSARVTKRGNYVIGGVVLWNLYTLSRGCV